MNADPVIAQVDRPIEEQREFMRELLARHERVTERLIRSLERTFSDIQEEARANTEETRAQTQAILCCSTASGPRTRPPEFA